MKASKKYLIGIDLGGTQLRFILADRKTGNVINIIPNKNSKISYDSPLCKKKEIFADAYFAKIPESQKISSYVVMKLQEYLRYMNVKPNSIAGIGISVAGKIQSDHRFIGSNVPLKYAVKVGKYYGVDLITGLKELFPKDTKISIENDANCSGLAQAIYYKHLGIDPNTTFYITVSTGIGGGGPKRDLDEVGHIIVDGYFPKLVPLCGCGATGCIEAYASGEGLRNQALHILNFYFNDKTTFEQLNIFEYIRSENKYNLQYMVDCSKLKQLYLEKKDITTKQIFDFANIDKLKDFTDQFALYLIEVASERFAKILVSLSNIHGIERFGLGGSVVLKNPNFLEIVKEKVSLLYKTPENIFKTDLMVEVSPLGEYINDYGALLLVVDSVYEKNWIDTIIKMIQSFKT